MSEIKIPYEYVKFAEPLAQAAGKTLKKYIEDLLVENMENIIKNHECLQNLNADDSANCVAD